VRTLGSGSLSRGYPGASINQDAPTASAKRAMDDAARGRRMVHLRGPAAHHSHIPTNLAPTNRLPPDWMARAGHRRTTTVLLAARGRTERSFREAFSGSAPTHPEPTSVLQQADAAPPALAPARAALASFFRSCRRHSRRLARPYGGSSLLVRSSLDSRRDDLRGETDFVTGKASPFPRGPR